MQPTQSWNKLIIYIKDSLGYPLNLIEYSDKKIQDIIRNDILPLISGKCGKIVYIPLSEKDRDTSDNYRGLNIYKIPTDDKNGGEHEIIDVIEVCYNINSTNVFPNSFNIGISDPHDVVMHNTMKDAYAYLSPYQSHRFIHPNYIKFEMILAGDGNALLECKCVHTNLDTIPKYIYNNILKDLCVAKIQENLCAMRSKYEILSTPIGDIKVNFQTLSDNARALREKAEEKLEALPPDILVGFI